jgi:hypothetical protein
MRDSQIVLIPNSFMDFSIDFQSPATADNLGLNVMI